MARTALHTAMEIHPKMALHCVQATTAILPTMAILTMAMILSMANLPPMLTLWLYLQHGFAKDFGEVASLTDAVRQPLTLALTLTLPQHQP